MFQHSHDEEEADIWEMGANSKASILIRQHECNIQIVILNCEECYSLIHLGASFSLKSDSATFSLNLTSSQISSPKLNSDATATFVTPRERERADFDNAEPINRARRRVQVEPRRPRLQ